MSRHSSELGKAVVTWFAAIGALAALAGAGSVRTRDGTVYDGEVALDDGAVVVRPAGGGPEQRVEWGAVARATLATRPAAERPVGSADGGLPQGWQGGDVGGVHSPGGATCDPRGLFTIKASGWGAWGPDDSVYFLSRPLDGDGQIIAHVAGVDDAHGKMVAGVMVRESVAGDAPMAAALVYPSGEVRLNRRPIGEMAPPKRADEAAARAWVRLTRKGDVFSAYSSRDGRDWEFVESRIVPMKPQAMIGLSASTMVNASVGEARIDSVQFVPGAPAATYYEGGEAVTQGVVLRDGTVVAGAIRSADAAAVKLVRGDREQSFPRETVARLVFNPPPPGLLTERRPPGILLTNGDFIEGDVAGVADRPATWPRPPQSHVAVNSLLFGVKQFEIARQVVLAVTADVTPGPAAFEVRTADGSVYRAKAVAVKKDGVTVDGESVGEVVDVQALDPASPGAAAPVPAAPGR